MNDKFLYQNRPALRAKFVEELYQKLNYKENTILTFWNIQKKRSSFWITAVILFIVLAACVQKIIGTNFHAIEADLNITFYEVNYALHIPPGDWAYEPFPKIAETDSSLEDFTAETNMISLDEAIRLLPYTFNYPSYLPEGFSLQNKYFQSTESLTSKLEDKINLSWAPSNNEGFVSLIYLSVRPDDNRSRTIKVAPGKWENIELNDRTPAILINGSFPWIPPKPFEYDFDNHIRVYWDDNAGASLLWEKDGIAYWFVTVNPDISGEELILMAESMINN